MSDKLSANWALLADRDWLISLSLHLLLLFILWNKWSFWSKNEQLMPMNVQWVHLAQEQVIHKKNVTQVKKSIPHRKINNPVVHSKTKPANKYQNAEINQAKLRALQQQATQQLKQLQTHNLEIQSLVQKYGLWIKQKVTQYWNYPLDSTKNMTATVQLKLTTTGELANLLLVKSSGSNAFDDSVLQAIHNAVPFDFLDQINKKIFVKHFAYITLKFSPQDNMQ